MSWLRFSPSTRRLTESDYVLTARHDGQKLLRYGLAGLGVAGVLALVFWLFMVSMGPMVQVSRLEAENSELKREAEQARLQYEMEHATRTQLEEQMAGLTRQLKQVNDELQFLRRGHGSSR